MNRTPTRDEYLNAVQTLGFSLQSAEAFYRVYGPDSKMTLRVPFRYGKQVMLVIHAAAMARCGVELQLRTVSKAAEQRMNKDLDKYLGNDPEARARAQVKLVDE